MKYVVLLLTICSVVSLMMVAGCGKKRDEGNFKYKAAPVTIEKGQNVDCSICKAKGNWRLRDTDMQEGTKYYTCEKQECILKYAKDIAPAMSAKNAAFAQQGGR